MTKLREPGSHHDALHQTITILGDAAAEAATGKSRGHLRQCSDPDYDREISYVDAVKLSGAVAARAGGEAPPLLTHLRLVCERLGGNADAAAAAPANPHVVLLGCVRALGELSGSFQTAMTDGTLSRHERMALKADLQDLRMQADALWRALEADPTDQRVQTLERDLRTAKSVAEDAVATAAHVGTVLKREQTRRLHAQNALADARRSGIKPRRAPR